MKNKVISQTLCITTRSCPALKISPFSRHGVEVDQSCLAPFPDKHGATKTVTASVLHAIG
jgi:hypothetical protein